MLRRLIRTYQSLDVEVIKAQLLIYGDLNGACGHCQHMEIKLDVTHCPGCQAEFKYVAFRNILAHMPKVHKLIALRADVVIVDFDDFKRAEGESKAKNLFGE